MNEIDNFQEFNKFFDLFDKAIKFNNIQEIRNHLQMINSIEEFFLKNYFKRKKEGVYYTNEAISKFICSEALIFYLKNKLLINDQLKSLDNFLDLNSNLKNKVSKTLLDISILDPACGSGVFLLSMINVIYNLLKKINPQLNDFNTKIQILNNLYGFDINNHAIKLSILKLFAWVYKENNSDYSQIISVLKSNLKVENSLNAIKSPKFNIIIGNPPYGNILAKKEKEILKKENIFHNDIYCAFLLKAIEWSNGIIGFLVPKSFLLRQGYVKFRNGFLSKVNILKIFDIGSNVFKNATNEVQIIFYEKRTNNSYRDLKIFDFPDKEIITYWNQKVDQLKICFNLKCPLCLNSKKFYIYTLNRKCPYCSSKTVDLNRIRIKPKEEIYQLINKIEKKGNLNYLNSIEFPKMVRGEESKGLVEVKKKLMNNTGGTCFFINAKLDFKYYHFKRNKSLNIEEINAKVLKGTNYEYYLKSKLLIKHNNIIPEAIFTEENACFTSSIYSLLHNDIAELKYLCAVLNSSLIQFYCIYAINNQKDTTINLNQYMIRHLPIVKPNKPTKIEIVSRVEQIISYLNNNRGVANEKIYQLLREIDDLIFDLYSLTDNERRFIILEVKDKINHFKIVYEKK